MTTRAYTDNHSQLFGRGCTPVTAREKILLLLIYSNLGRLWENQESRETPNLDKEFEALTGFDPRRRRAYQAELDDPTKGPAGHFLDGESRASRGRKKKPPLEDEFAELSGGDSFADWMEAKAQEAMKGHSLTLDSIQDDYEQEFQKRTTKKRVRAALYRCGFRWISRIRSYVSKRHSAGVLPLLWAYVNWVKDSTEEYTDTDGKTKRFNFRYPTSFEDESSMRASETSRQSWCSKATRYLDIKKGGSTIIRMVGSLFSFCSGKDTWVAWSSRWTDKKKHEFTGNFDSKMMTEYHSKYVFSKFDASGTDPPGVHVVDNASTHKAYVGDLRKASVDDIESWIFENTEELPEVQDKFHKLYNDASIVKTKELYLDFIKQEGLRVLELQQVAALYHLVLRYTAPYWSPGNPVEYLWAELKRLYRLTPSDLDWQERMQLARAGISEDFERKCLDRAIKWCLRKHAEMVKEGWTDAGPPPAVPMGLLLVHEDNDSAHAPSDAGSDIDEEPAAVPL